MTLSPGWKCQNWDEILNTLLVSQKLLSSVCWKPHSPTNIHPLELGPRTQNSEVGLYVQNIFVSSACGGLVYCKGQGICRQNLNLRFCFTATKLCDWKQQACDVICVKEIILTSFITRVLAWVCKYQLSDKYGGIRWMWRSMKVSFQRTCCSVQLLSRTAVKVGEDLLRWCEELDLRR